MKLDKYPLHCCRWTKLLYEAKSVCRKKILTLNYLWDRFSGEHALVDDAGASEEKEIAGNEVVVLGPIHRNDVADNQLIRRNWSPSAVSVNLDKVLYKFVTSIVKVSKARTYFPGETNWINQRTFINKLHQQPLFLSHLKKKMQFLGRPCFGGKN